MAATRGYSAKEERILENEVVKELKLHFHAGMIRQLAKSRFTIDDGLDIADCGEKVRQLVHKYLVTQGIEVRDPIQLLDNRFKEEVESYTTPESKAAQIEHAVKKEISVKIEKDEVYYTKIIGSIEGFVAEV